MGVEVLGSWIADWAVKKMREDGNGFELTKADMPQFMKTVCDSPKMFYRVFGEGMIYSTCLTKSSSLQAFANSFGYAMVPGLSSSDPLIAFTPAEARNGQ